MSQKPARIDVIWSGQALWMELALPVEQGGGIRLDSAAWFAWLEAAQSVSFSYPILDRRAGWIGGSITVRKERRVRGGQYWVAYRRHSGRVRKVYLGRSSQVTSARLAAVAAQWGATSE
jgi:LuxR family maltose regulon positive regulatory protein